MKIDKIWEQYDEDRNGYLDKEEARKFIEDMSDTLLKSLGHHLSKRVFDDVFEHFDLDKSGTIDKDEMG